MTADSAPKTADRNVTILWANTWGLTFLIYALLLDIVYRSAALHEAAWDLFAVLFFTGVIQFAYAAWHHVLILNRNRVIIVLVGSIFAAIVSFLLALSKAF